ncbi:MAG: iron-containing alcohol dehydrogenase [Lachnospiraceae bacterium]|nr:iron-containing alcohol dehydrogenase [Lachnospiraceae bacterium]
MENFVQYAPTEVIFGKGTENQTGEEVKKWGGSRVLLVYGGGSAVRSGLIGRVEQSLTEAGIAYEEFGGVKPNPRLAFAEEGVQKALTFGADFILAVGGGSAIDTAKAIAHGTANPEEKLWDIWTRKVPLTRSLPVAAVLTIPAAGSEMSDSAVLTNEEIGKKAGINTPFNRCRFAVMNPELAATLPAYQVACGVTDIMMHTMERYFIPGIQCEMTDCIAEGLLRTVIRNGAKVYENPADYDAMAEVMWCGSLSHNNLTECGRGKDFSVHKLGHALSARYDVAHGASLAAVWGSWARYLYQDQALGRFVQFAKNVWGISGEGKSEQETALAGIEKTEEFFRSIGMPVSLSQLGVQPGEEERMELSLDATMGDTVKLTRIRPLGAKEVNEIYQMAM